MFDALSCGFYSKRLFCIELYCKTFPTFNGQHILERKYILNEVVKCSISYNIRITKANALKIVELLLLQFCFTILSIYSERFIWAFISKYPLQHNWLILSRKYFKIWVSPQPLLCWVTIYGLLYVSIPEIVVQELYRQLYVMHILTVWIMKFTSNEINLKIFIDFFLYYINKYSSQKPTNFSPPGKST